MDVPDLAKLRGKTNRISSDVLVIFRTGEITTPSRAREHGCAPVYSQSRNGAGDYLGFDPADTSKQIRRVKSRTSKRPPARAIGPQDSRPWSTWA